jgi:hypothetical protein
LVSYTERVLKEYLNLRGKEWWEAGEDCIMRSFMTCTIKENIVTMIIPRRIGWTGHVARMGKMRNPYDILVGEPEWWKRPLSRPRRRWEDNIRMDAGEVG